MKQKQIFIFAALFMITSFAWSSITLKGTLMTDDGCPIPHTKISVTGGPSETTDDNGLFRLKLSNEFLDGERVILIVHKKGWIINYPLDGEWNLPNVKYQSVHKIKVIIVPRGSKALWQHARIEKFIVKLMAENPKLDEGNKDNKPDFNKVFRFMADKYGFSTEQVKAKFDEWALEMKKSEDLEKNALGNYYLGNYKIAAELFAKVAITGERDLQIIQKKLKKQELKIYENWKRAGNSLIAANDFDSALKKYQKAEKIATREKYPEKWIEINNLLGIAKAKLGYVANTESCIPILNEAMNYFENILKFCSTEGIDLEWAGAQHNLGSVLLQIGKKVNGRLAKDYFESAVRKFELALKIRTKEKQPLQWAITQCNLGNALKNIATKTIMSGEEAKTILGRSVIAFKNALKVFSVEKNSLSWAGTQNNLGLSLWELGKLTSADDNVKFTTKAIIAFQNALNVYTREKNLYEWICTHFNLGKLFQELGKKNSNIMYLQHALGLYQKILAAFSEDQFPHVWANLQNNLGYLYWNLSYYEKGELARNLLIRSHNAYTNALKKWNKSTSPQQYAMVQLNLGLLLNDLGSNIGGAEALKIKKKALLAMNNALQMYEKQFFPMQWAQAQRNLGLILFELGQRAKKNEGRECLVRAVQAWKNALQLVDKSKQPNDWALIQNAIGQAFCTLAGKSQGKKAAENLNNAILSFQSALQVTNKSKQPDFWAQLQKSLHDCYENLHGKTSEKEAKEIFVK